MPPVRPGNRVGPRVARAVQRCPDMKITLPWWGAGAVALVPLAACDPDAAFMDNPHPEVVPLIDWYSETNSDHYATFEAPPSGQGYELGHLDGYLFDPAEPPPFILDNAALTGYWSESRHDYVVSSDPDFTPPGGGDHVDTRLEGYVFTRGLSGTVPLQSWYSDSAQDGYQTTHHAWHPDAGPDPSYGFVRTEGFILDGAAWNDEAVALGQGSMLVDGLGATQVRPLLLIKGEYPNGTITFAHDLAYYDALVFGDSWPNMVDYFLEASNGRFTFSRAGAFEVTYDDTVNDIAPAAQFAAQRIAEQGFDFEPYDTDGDGLVESNELGFLTVDNGSDIYAAARWGGCVDIPGQSVDVCVGSSTGQPGAAAVGEETSFMNIPHELSHLLGTWDLYGVNCNSYQATLMSCTITTGVFDERTSYLIDPWHAMVLGWVTPRVRSTLSPGSVERLDAPQLASDSGLTDESPLLFWDPRRGAGEYIMVEYRAPTAAGGTSYDRNAPGTGVYIWQVMLDASKNPIVVPDPGGGGDARTVWSYGAPGSATTVTPWTAANGEITLRWMDGSDAGVRLIVGAADPAGRVVVEWRRADAPLAPRIDQISDGPYHPGGTITIDGAFGVAQAGRRVFFGTESGDSELPVTSWSPYQLVVQIPDGVRTGGGFLRIDNGAGAAGRSNSVNIGIE